MSDAARAVPRLEDCFFYHVMDLPGLGSIEQSGSWDLRGRFADYTGHVDVRGRSVLDVGTASGFLSFEAERHGAREVVSFDADSQERMQYLPYPDIPDGRPTFDKIRNSYWLAHHALGSKARLVCGDLYRMAEVAPASDVVLVSQILVHLRDPLGAIEQAARCARDYLIVSEGAVDDDRPIARFLGGTGNYYSWWHLSTGLYHSYLAVLGFGVVSLTTQSYRCNHPAALGNVPITTIVAKRGAAPIPPSPLSRLRRAARAAIRRLAG